MNRQKQIMHVSAVGIAGNVVLVVFKMIVGVITGSVAIVADAVNNLADAMSSVVTMIGTKLASKRPDRKHPYGYGQIEYLTSVVIAVLILYTGVSTFMDALDRILHPQDTMYDTAAIIVIAAGIAVKILLGRYFKASGKKTQSEALIASGEDASLDAVVSSSILVGAAIRLIFGVSIDGWLGAGIAVIIIKSGIDVLRTSLSQIIGERVPDDLAKSIKSIISKEPDVLGVYDLILNRYGPERVIGSVHIQVADEMTALQIDALSRRISGTIYEDCGIILTVGIYAANLADPQAQKMFRTLHEFAAKESDILQVHGFYVDSSTKTVTFDLVIDFACEDPEGLRRKIVDEMKKAYPEYTFSAVLDSDFSA